MDNKIGIFVALALLLGGMTSSAEESVDVTKSVKEILESINQRYDNFFQYRNHLQQRLDRMQQGVDERKQYLEQHAIEMERARQQLVAEKKERPSDEPMRLAWEAQQKERAKQIESLRKQYVEKRDYFEDYMKKGRQIPEMKEYDLEGY